MSTNPARGGGMLRLALGVTAAAAMASSAFAGGPVNFGSVDAFNGVEGLDLSGEFLYTVNVSPNTSEAFAINDLMFTSSGATAGVSVVSAHGRDNWLDRPVFTPSFGSDGLESVMWDMQFSGRGDVNIDLAVQTGAQYKLQLLFSDAYWTSAGNRFFDVVVEGATAIDEFDILSFTGPRQGPVSTGAVFTYVFTALDDTLDIDLLRGSQGLDTNPLINGISLEIVPSPAAFVLLATGACPLLVSRRRRGEK